MAKKDSEKFLMDRNLIEECEKAVSTLIILSEADDELKSSLKVVKEKVKYLVPSVDDKIYEYDRRIKNLIDDMKIALVEARGESNRKVRSVLAEIKVAIADRNARI